MVTPSRRIHPSVENNDTYMWSSTKTWLRSMDRRSRYSGRSWCATVATVACGSGSSSGEGLICSSLLFGKMEALRLQVEHGPIAAAQRHQLVVRSQLDD